MWVSRTGLVNRLGLLACLAWDRLPWRLGYGWLGLAWVPSCWGISRSALSSAQSPVQSEMGGWGGGRLGHK